MPPSDLTRRVRASRVWSRPTARRGIAPDPLLDSHNVRRAFRSVLRAAEIEATEWTPRELRHSFVSLLSDGGMSLEDISRLMGHSGTSVTETVYRHQIRPVLEAGSQAMDQIFPSDPDESPAG